MNNKAPRAVKDSKNRFYVVYYLNGRRNRVSSGSSLGIDIHPNKAHPSEGLHLALKLALSIHEKIEARELASENGSSTQLQFAVTVFNLPEHYRLSYKKAFNITKRRFLLFINSANQSKFKLSNYTHSEASSFLHSKMVTPSSFNTGSLTTLQSAMGHASLAVTLGYLRGLEIPSLRLEDMPRI